MTQRRVVVAGGAGFIGSHLCEQLLDRGDRVVCIDNFSTSDQANIEHLIDDPRFVLIEHDVTMSLPAVGAVEAVFNLASPASPVQYARLPLETLWAGALGTRNCLDLAREHRARFILASTSEVYGDPTMHPQAESYWGNVNPVGPRSVYDEAKRFAEALTAAYRREYGVDTAIARIFNCYGPRLRADDGRAVPTFITQALRDEPITVSGDGSQTRSLCFVADLVNGLLALMDVGVHGPINLGTDHEVTMLGLAEIVRALVGSDSTIVFVGRPEDDPATRRPDLSLARAELGWAPRVSLFEGLQQTITWFRNGAPRPRALNERDASWQILTE